jgi:hypothetical protein
LEAYLSDRNHNSIAALDADGGTVKATTHGQNHPFDKLTSSSQLAYLLFSTAFWAYSTWNILPSGENVPHE